MIGNFGILLVISFQIKSQRRTHIFERTVQVQSYSWEVQVPCLAFTRVAFVFFYSYVALLIAPSIALAELSKTIILPDAWKLALNSEEGETEGGDDDDDGGVVRGVRNGERKKKKRKGSIAWLVANVS